MSVSTPPQTNKYLRLETSLHDFWQSSSVFTSCVCLSLHPGGSVDIDLEVFVNRSTAPDLNSGKEQIEDILVLHLERGKDYFISVAGNYLPSCYGTSIRSLCQLREPVQDMPQETLRELVRETCSIVTISSNDLCSLKGHLIDHSWVLFLSLFFALFLSISGWHVRRWERSKNWKAFGHS